MRKIICIFISIILLTLPLFSIAEDNINVLLDNKTLSFDSTPVIVNNRTMVPMRTIFEALGYTVDWNQSEGRIESIGNNGDVIVLYINKLSSYKNGELLSLDAAPFIQNDRTMVPLRFVAEMSGAKVMWNDSTLTVSIVSQQKKMTFTTFPDFITIPAPMTDFISFRAQFSKTTYVYYVNLMTKEKIQAYEQKLINLGFWLLSDYYDTDRRVFMSNDYTLKIFKDNVYYKIEISK